MLSVRPRFSKSSKAKQISSEDNAHYWRDCGYGRLDHWWHLYWLVSYQEGWKIEFSGSAKWAGPKISENKIHFTFQRWCPALKVLILRKWYCRILRIYYPLKMLYRNIYIAKLKDNKTGVINDPLSRITIRQVIGKELCCFDRA